MIAGFVGARIFHILWEEPKLYWENPEWAFMFWYGGFVWYGGAIAAVLAGAFYVKLIKESFWQWADFFAPIGALGYSLGRVSCLIAGCCYGRSCNLPWAVGGLHPTQAYAVIWEFLVFLVLTVFRKKFHRTGDLFLTWVVMHSLGRIVMEYFRDDFRGGFMFGFSISTIISILLIWISSFLLLKTKISK